MDVDVESERQILLDQFDVLSPATTILVVDGEIVQRWFGPINEQAVTEQMQRLVDEGYSGDEVPFPTPTPEPEGVEA